MAKWKCEICGNEFENFHAQGFDNKIYCPLCYFKKENQELKKQLEEIYKFKFSYRKDETKMPPIIRKQKDVEIIKNLENQQKEFIKYLEDEFTKIQNDIEKEIDNNVKYFKVERRQIITEILQKYKEII